MNYPHRAGNVYQYRNETSSRYMLCLVEAVPRNRSKLALISMVTGNRWTEPLEIETENRLGNALTEEEFAQLHGDADGFWSLVRGSMQWPDSHGL